MSTVGIRTTGSAARKGRPSGAPDRAHSRLFPWLQAPPPPHSRPARRMRAWLRRKTTTRIAGRIRNPLVRAPARSVPEFEPSCMRPRHGGRRRQPWRPRQGIKGSHSVGVRRIPANAGPGDWHGSSPFERDMARSAAEARARCARSERKPSPQTEPTTGDCTGGGRSPDYATSLHKGNFPPAIGPLCARSYGVAAGCDDYIRCRRNYFSRGCRGRCRLRGRRP